MERQEDRALSYAPRKWQNIKISGTEYVIALSATDESWQISLSNLIEVWSENITKDIALQRCQSLNMLLDVDSFDVKKTLDELLSDIPKHATDISLPIINLKMTVEGIAFRFKIELTKGNAKQLWNEITKRLCQSAAELQRRHEILIDLIKRKDEEISEYRFSGAQLTRKNIETLPYNEDIYRRNVPLDTSNADECIKTFISMSKLYNEFENHEYDPTNNARCLSRETGNQNHVNPDVKIKLENTETSETTETVNNDETDETRQRIKIETAPEASSTSENGSGVSRSKHVGENKTATTKSSTRKVKTHDEIQNKRSIALSIALPSVQTNKPKRVKRTRNIHDLIK